ncbi:MAG: hypothetical protein GEU26_10255 [Nitrososphaeraceae archaeon]|nr:hypothetical protein [Nitrososphaeraceae archaeon]
MVIRLSQMIEDNTSKFRGLDNGRITEKISNIAKGLNFSDERMTFIEHMISLNRLLSSYDPHESTSFRTVDEKAQDPTYFIATYFDTKDIDQALWVYRLVRLLTRYILLSDKFFETDKVEFALIAKRVRTRIDEFLLNRTDKDHLNYSLDYSLTQFWAFWKFEQIIKCRTLAGNTFSYNEIRHFNLFKSSDAPIVYSRVLDAKLPSFTENVSLVLHYNQALLDLQDDWEDIEEDVQADMPNVFVMAAVQDVSYNSIKSSTNDRIRNIVLKRSDSSKASIIRLVNEYQSSIRNICIPNNLAFLKSLSDHYADTLRGTILSPALYQYCDRIVGSQEQ